MSRHRRWSFGVIVAMGCLLVAVAVRSAPVVQAPGSKPITEIRMQRLHLDLLSGDEVILRLDDTATYERGKDFPKRRGTVQRGRLEKGTFERLSRLLDDGGLSQWGDKYEVAAFHRTKYLLTVKRESGERVISDYGQAGPPSLWAFELVVERLIDSTAWK